MPAVVNGSLFEAVFTTEASSPLSRHKTLREELITVRYEKPAGYYSYEKFSVCEHPGTFEDFVNKMDPVQNRFLSLEMDQHEDLAVNKVNYSKKCHFQKRFPALEKEKSEKSEKVIPKSSPWDHPLHPDQDLSGGHLPVYSQGPSEDDFLAGASEEVKKLEDPVLDAILALG